MNLQSERIDDICQALKLLAVAQEWSGIAQQAARDESSYADFLEQLLQVEQQARTQRTRETLLRLAGLPAMKHFEDYDFTFATGAPRQQLQELTSLAFVERKEKHCPAGAKRRGQKPSGHLPGAVGDPA